MSEFINNREEHQKVQVERQEKLKELILKLHEGESFEAVKKEFED